MKKITTIKERILQFIKDQNINKEFFFREIGYSGENFKGNRLFSEIGSDKIVKIITLYPDISLEWLILGKGNILRTEEKLAVVKEEETIYGSGDKKYLNVLEKYFELTEENNELKTKIKELEELINKTNDKCNDL